MKKILSLLLALCIMVSLCPLAVFAQDDVPADEFAAEAANNANSWRYVDGELRTDLEDASPYLSIPAARPSNATKVGIDVSEWQGNIDWEKVKADGVEFAILRVGYGMNDTDQDDPYFERNADECERLGIPYGVYIYSYATSTSRASSEADHVLRLIEGRNLSYPVYFDMEDASTIGYDLGAIATTFCNKISAAGYPVGVYASLNWWNNYLTAGCFNNWYRWVAQFNNTCHYTGTYAIWQCSSSGSVNGINGRVDMNYLIGTPADHGTVAESYLRTNKNTYVYGEPIITTANSTHSGAWVAIYADSDTIVSGTQSFYWYYVSGNGADYGRGDLVWSPGMSYDILSDTVCSNRILNGSFVNGALPVGKYKVALMYGDYLVEMSKTITITEALSTDKSSYETGESIYVTANSDASGAWVGLYKPGETPSESTNSILWYYVADLPGPVDITKSRSEIIVNRPSEFGAGEYALHLFGDSGYTNIIDTVNFTITEPVHTTHTPGTAVEENRVEATCGKPGSYDSVIKCTGCGKEISRTAKTIPATGNHTNAPAIEENRVEATCGKPGSYDSVIKCSGCKKELSRTTQTIPATGKHTNAPAIEENRVEATCGKPGSYDSVIKCSVCKTLISRTAKTIPATGNHTNAPAVEENRVEPTCGKPGSYDSVVYCSVCTTQISRAAKTIPATGNHTGGIATCKDRAICSVCEQPYGTTDATNHTGGIEVRNAKEATPDHEGYTGDTYCKGCDTMIEAGQTIPKGSHVGGIATCVSPAICEECGKSYGQKDPNNHTGGTEIRNQKEATASAPGYTGDTHCKGCGVLLTEGETIPALGYPEISLTITRIAGSGRCETAIEAANVLKAKQGVEKFNSIILASGNTFADALPGSYLAAAKNAPILLHRDNKTALNKEYILNNLANGGTVYLLGGTSAIPASVGSELSSAGISVRRLAGNSRFETNLAILEAGGFSGGRILVCTAYNFADSLSASATGLPILLLNPKWEDLSDDYKAYLKGKNCEFIVIGGYGAISQELESALQQLGTVERIAGDNRYDTSVKVAKEFFNSVETVALAYGGNFPDGLCGGPLAYAYKAPLILTSAKYESIAMEYITTNPVSQGYVLGGTGVLSEGTVNAAFGK